MLSSPHILYRYTVSHRHLNWFVPFKLISLQAKELLLPRIPIVTTYLVYIKGKLVAKFIVLRAQLE